VDRRLHDGVRALKLPRTEAEAFRALIWVAVAAAVVVAVVLVVRAVS
jgi:hypothetical protein